MKNLILYFFVLLISCSTPIEYESIAKNDSFRASITHGDFVKLEVGYTYYNYTPGEGTPLLLIHSFSVPSYQWDHTTEVAIKKGMPVISLDLYGRGNSSNPDTLYSIELFENQVIQLLDYLDIDEKVNIAGVSMGGAVISQIAAHHPDKINKLIFVSPRGFLDPISLSVPNEEKGVSEYEVKEFISKDFPIRAEGQLEDFYHKEDFHWWVDLYRPLLYHEHFARALISTNKNMRSTQQENVMIGLFDFPVHFIWGTHDVVFPIEKVQHNVINWIPRAKQHIVDSCGHMPHIEKTEEFDNIFFNEIL